MNRRITPVAWLCACVLATGSVAAATGDVSTDASPSTPATSKSADARDVLSPFDDRYAVTWAGVGVGDIDMKLAPKAGAPGCHVFTAVSHPSWVASLLYGAPRQTSVFCVVDGRIRSQSYRFVMPGDKGKSYTLDFDWHKHIVTDDRGRVRSIPPDAVDSLALQQAVRLWVKAHVGAHVGAHAGAHVGARAGDDKSPEATFTLVDDKHLTHYRLQLAGRRIIDTPAGRFDAWLMERVDNPDKIGRYWLAPGRDDLPVATETKNGDSPTMRLTLRR